MKKFFFLVSVLVASLTINAEVFTLDLAHPTNPSEFTYGAEGMWTETWNDEVPNFEAQIFSFSHLPSGNSYGGTSWEGFTISKATEGDYYANVAKGGLAGEGTPYILGYFSEYWTYYSTDENEDMISSNLIIFNDGNAYYPREVYLNNSLIGRHDVLEGNSFGGRPFAQGDMFEVWIYGLDEEYYYEISDEKVVYRLADYTSENSDEWFINEEWAKVDLSELGQVYGLAFVVVSTDQAYGYTNTATYFALDGLKVSTTADEPTAVINTNAEIKATKAIRDGQVVIVRDGKTFNVLGAEL